MAEVPAAAPDVASPPRSSFPKWRRILVAVLVVLGCVLAPISVMGVWISNTLLNTDQYVATVGPLAGNAAVQDAIANRVTNSLVAGADLEAKVKDALPPKAGFVAPFVTKGIGSFVHGVTLKIVQSPKFEQLWRTLNRRAHARVIEALKGQGKHIKNNGQVTIDLGPIIDKANAALEKQGIDVLSSKAGGNNQITLISSSTLKTAQSGVRVLDALRIVLPILTVLLFAAAIALSPNRRRTILRGALGVGLAMVLLLTVFNLARSAYLDALPASVSQSAAGAVYDQLLSFLRLALRTIFAFAVVVALGAWLAGPGRSATRIRTGARNLVSRTPGQSAISPRVAGFVDHYRNPLRVVVVGVGLLVLVLLNHPGPIAVLVLAILVLLFLGVIEVLARGARAPEPAGSKT
jgi:hypothetical protein